MKLGVELPNHQELAVVTTVPSSAPDAIPGKWSTIVQALARPYPVSVPMIVLVSLVPLYIFIPLAVAGRTLHAPALALDDLLPVKPAWALVYGSVYLFLILLPVFVVRQQEHVRRTVFAYLMIWILAYACFLAYPTVAPRPASVMGDGFAVWGLRSLYSADPPYNCFPSLHVAHAFVSALTCFRLHRGVGIAAVICAGLVAVSTLFTKQHYVADVVAGVSLAFLAYALFLRKYPVEPIPEVDRRSAPLLALVVIGIVGLGLAAYWVAYRLGVPA